MNRSHIVIATTFAAFLGTGAAFAAEGTQDFPATQTYSTQSRAVVKAELVAAQRAGTIETGEASARPTPASTLTRTQVVAEAREATRLGLVSVNEGGQRQATPAELESIRLAGERAISTNVASRSK